MPLFLYISGPLVVKGRICYSGYMNKLVPFTKISGYHDTFSFLSEVSVAVDKKGSPVGFVFGRDSFITFLEKIDSEFEKKIKDPKSAYNNLAGKLIDMIEEKLPLNPIFVKELRNSIRETKNNDWISFKDVLKTLNV